MALVFLPLRHWETTSYRALPRFGHLTEAEIGDLSQRERPRTDELTGLPQIMQLSPRSALGCLQQFLRARIQIFRGVPFGRCPSSARSVVRPLRPIGRAPVTQ